MAGKIKTEFSEDVINVLGKSGIGKLSDENTSELLKSLKSEKEKGLFGNWFGTKPESSVMYISLVICVIVMAIGLLVILFRIEFASEYWKAAFPVITGNLGYMYGKHGDKK